MRDAQAPIGATDFDELDAGDSDAEESDDDTVSLNPRRRRGPMSRFFDSDTLPSRTDDYFDNLGGAGMDTIVQDTLAGAGLAVARDDVHGAGLLSYPGEGLVRDGLSYVANAVHNI